MEVYLLDAQGSTYGIIDDFVSCILTERYIEPGEFKLIFQASQENRRLFNPKDIFLKTNVSPEIVVVDTREVADGLLTITGRTMEPILENHIVPVVIPGDALTFTDRPGRIITRLIQTVMDHVRNKTSNFGTTKLQYLELGPQVLDASLPRVTEVFQSGTTVYSQVLGLANKYNIGLSMQQSPFLQDYSYNEDSAPNYIFSTYRGVDRTKNQTDRERVLFSPSLDNFQGVKELKSWADAVNLVDVYPPEELLASYVAQYPVASNNGFVRVSRETYGAARFGWEAKRKIIVANITAEQVGARGDGQPSIVRLMRQAGANELREHKAAHVIDGEVIPRDDLKYRRDYKLGDLVELDAWSDVYNGAPATATVSEYIYSQDASGERAYPTVVVSQNAIGEQFVFGTAGTQ